MSNKNVTSAVDRLFRAYGAYLAREGAPVSRPELRRRVREEHTTGKVPRISVRSLLPNNRALCSCQAYRGRAAGETWGARAVHCASGATRDLQIRRSAAYSYQPET